MSSTSDDHTSVDPCLICGTSAKGLHFQVSSCRACAAFFRRSLKTRKVYRCQKGTGNCDLTNKVRGKPLCRFCRMNKCAAIGMSAEMLNEQMTYARPSPLEKRISLPSTPVTFVVVGEKLVVDWPTMEALIRENLVKIPEVTTNTHLKLTEIQSMKLGFDKLVSYGWPDSDVKLIKDCMKDKQPTFDFYTLYIVYIAQLMAASENFQKLSPDDKFAMFKHLWINCQQLERLYTTCQNRGYDVNDQFLYLDKKHLIDVSTANFTMCEMTEEERNNYVKMNVPLNNLYHTYIAMPFKTMKVTAVEAVFVLILIMWDVREVKNLSSEAIQMASDTIEKASIEMHNYYTYEVNNKVYSPRITKLTKLAQEIQRLSQDRRNLTTMGQMFNLFHTDLCGAENLWD